MANENTAVCLICSVEVDILVIVAHDARIIPSVVACQIERAVGNESDHMVAFGLQCGCRFGRVFAIRVAYGLTPRIEF